MCSEREIKELFTLAHKTFEYCETTGILTRKSTGKRVGTVHSRGYRYVGLNRKIYREHRLIWLMKTGSYTETIDHKNRDGLDNRWCNLRESTHEKQNLNREFKGKFVGATLCKLTGKYSSNITFRGRKHYLGRYDTPEEASNVYMNARERLRSGKSVW